MTEKKKKIAALTLATSMLISTIGCSKKEVNSLNTNNSNLTQTNNIKLDNLDNYFIVELTNLNNEKLIYLTTKKVIVQVYTYPKIEYKIINKDITIAQMLKSEYTSEYGEIINIIPIKQFISIYTELKESYTEEEIYKVFESVKKDYDKLIKNEKVKKLKLK